MQRSISYRVKNPPLWHHIEASRTLAPLLEYPITSHKINRCDRSIVPCHARVTPSPPPNEIMPQSIFRGLFWLHFHQQQTTTKKQQRRRQLIGKRATRRIQQQAEITLQKPVAVTHNCPNHYHCKSRRGGTTAPLRMPFSALSDWRISQESTHQDTHARDRWRLDVICM